MVAEFLCTLVICLCTEHKAVGVNQHSVFINRTVKLVHKVCKIVCKRVDCRLIIRNTVVVVLVTCLINAVAVEDIYIGLDFSR